MFEVAISSLLMLLVIASVVGLFTWAVTPRSIRRQHLPPGITSRGAMMLFQIDH